MTAAKHAFPVEVTGGQRVRTAGGAAAGAAAPSEVNLKKSAEAVHVAPTPAATIKPALGKLPSATLYMWAPDGVSTTTAALESWAAAGLLELVDRTVILADPAIAGALGSVAQTHKATVVTLAAKSNWVAALAHAITESQTELIFFIEKDYIVCPAATGRMGRELPRAADLLKRSVADVVLLRSSLDPGPNVHESDAQLFCSPGGLQLYKVDAHKPLPIDKAELEAAARAANSDQVNVGAAAACFEDPLKAAPDVWTLCDAEARYYCFRSFWGSSA